MAKDSTRCATGGGRGPRHGYTGLFSPRVAPASRAYCILCSFSGGVLLLTAGSVLCHVIARHPESGGRAMHTPPLAVAIAFIVAGAIMVIASAIIMCRYGVDDGDDNIEEESLYIASEDQLDKLYQRNLQQQLLIQRIIEEQIHKQLNSRREQQSCSRCSPTQDEVSSRSINRIACSESSCVNQISTEGDCRCRPIRRVSLGYGKCSGSTTHESSQRRSYESDNKRVNPAEVPVRPKEKSDLPVKLITNERCNIHSTCQCDKNSIQYREKFSTRPPIAANNEVLSSQSCSPSCSKIDTMASLRRLKPSTTSRGTSPIIRLQSPSQTSKHSPSSSTQHSPLISGVQGMNNSVTFNQKSLCSSKKIKMPSKIIATTDDICVVIDSQ